MTIKQFSSKILGKKLSTSMMVHRLSVKFYENGIVIKPIMKQGISCSKKYEEQIDNQKAIFLTNENAETLTRFLVSFEKAKDISNQLEEDKIAEDNLK